MEVNKKFKRQTLWIFKRKIRTGPTGEKINLDVLRKHIPEK